MHALQLRKTVQQKQEQVILYQMTLMILLDNRGKQITATESARFSESV